jgi:hypothetical protein
MKIQVAPDFVTSNPRRDPSSRSGNAFHREAPLTRVPALRGTTRPACPIPHASLVRTTLPRLDGSGERGPEYEAQQAKRGTDEDGTETPDSHWILLIEGKEYSTRGLAKELRVTTFMESHDSRRSGIFDGRESIPGRGRPFRIQRWISTIPVKRISTLSSSDPKLRAPAVVSGSVILRRTTRMTGVATDEATWPPN